MLRKSFCLVLAGFFVASTMVFAAVARNISPQDASALIRQKPGVFLLDVRTPDEYQQARLSGAHLIPIDQIGGRLGELPTDRPILVYCAVGSRSAQVFNFLTRRGYPEVYNLDGGIYAWAMKGYPVLRGLP